MSMISIKAFLVILCVNLLPAHAAHPSKQVKSALINAFDDAYGTAPDWAVHTMKTAFLAKLRGESWQEANVQHPEYRAYLNRLAEKVIKRDGSRSELAKELLAAAKQDVLAYSVLANLSERYVAAMSGITSLKLRAAGEDHLLLFTDKDLSIRDFVNISGLPCAYVGVNSRYSHFDGSREALSPWTYFRHDLDHAVHEWIFHWKNTANPKSKAQGWLL